MADALTGLGVPGGQIRLLAEGAATRGSVHGALDWLVANAGPDALAVVFFAGHVGKSGGAEELRLVDGGLRDTELARRLERLQARRAWVVVAGCFGGGFTEVLAPGRVLTGAAGPDQNAYESTEFNRSYLVQYMVRRALIERRSEPTVQAAFAYADAALGREHPEHRPVQFEMHAPPLDLRG